MVIIWLCCIVEHPLSGIAFLLWISYW